LISNHSQCKELSGVFVTAVFNYHWAELLVDGAEYRHTAAAAAQGLRIAHRSWDLDVRMEAGQRLVIYTSATATVTGSRPHT